MSPLPDDLRALAAEPPPVADWPAHVRRTVQARARRRATVSVAAALTLVVASSAGVVWARNGERDSTLAVATATPTPSPSAEEPEVRLELTVGEGGFLVPAGVALEVVAVAEVEADTPPVLRELRVDGTSEVPDAQFLCPLPEGEAPSPAVQRSRRTWTRTLTPGRHQLSVEVVPNCGHTSFPALTRVVNVEAVTPERTAAPRPPGSPTTPPAPAPTADPGPTYPPARNVVSIDITVSPARPRAGEEVTITVVARGDKGGVRFARISYDRGRKGIQGADVSCAPAEPVPPEPAEIRESFTHVYEEAGRDGIHAEVDSGCGYYQGTGSRTLHVDVAAAAEPSGGTAPAQPGSRG